MFAQILRLRSVGVRLVGLGMDDAVWNHAVFSKNRDRLLTSDVAKQFLAAVIGQAKRFMSDDHLTVDGALIRAWASQKNFRRKDGSDGDGANFHGQKRKNDTHESTTGPGRAAVQEELRHGVQAGSLADKQKDRSRRITVGADKAYYLLARCSKVAQPDCYIAIL